MKVFELMAYLAEMPAGAEVRMRSLKSLQEFAEFTESDEGLRIIDLTIEDVQQVNDSLVVLFN